MSSNTVPDKWTYESIEELSAKHKGAIKIGPFGSALSKKEMVSTGVKVYGQENVYQNDFKLGNYFITEEKYQKLKTCTLEHGDVVITMMGTVGSTTVVPVDAELGVMDSHLLRIQVEEERVDRKLLAMQLRDSQDVKEQISKMSQGGIMSGLNASIVKSIKVPLPPLHEQKKIAAILTSVDTVIEKTQAQINKLKDLKTGMMQELLTKGIGHTEFKDSPVGRIPVEWDVKLLKDCCELMTNGYVGATRDIYQAEGVNYVLCQNVRPNQFIENTFKHVSEEFHKKNIRACLAEGDVLTVQTGAGNGDTCVVPKSYEGANCHALIISRPKKDILNPFFFAEYMNSDIGKNRVSIIATGGAHPHLNTTDLRRELIPIPPIAEQNKIAIILNGIQDKYMLLERKKEQSIKVKKALMQDLLTGKVRVKV